MILSRIVLKNWRNFRDVDVEFGDRVFLVGPNASGKSNFLDAFRFMHDIVKPGGGLQSAIISRGEMKKIRCLAARQDPEVRMEFYFSLTEGQPWTWHYVLEIVKEHTGLHRSLISKEEVWRNGESKPVMQRPNKMDQDDKVRLTQTHLEQINSNREFREIESFFSDVQYLHIVPQFVRFPGMFSGILPDDPYGQDFLKRVSEVGERQRESRLRKIENALKRAVPQFTKLTYTQDKVGKPHLEATYEHWRAKGAKHQEDQFSDGTIRLIGLLWSMLESDSLLLLEEPELSLHSAIVRKIPALMDRINKDKRRQIIVSTHSADLLSNHGIGGEEILLFVPDKEGTKVVVASHLDDVRALLENGVSPADAVLPRTIMPTLTLPLWQEK